MAHKMISAVPPADRGGALARGRRDRPGDDRQDDEAQHIIAHRGAEDRLTLAALDGSEIAQHPRRDADAGGRERGPDEEVDEQRTLRQQPCRDAPAERHGCHDAEHGDPDPERRGAHPDEGTQVGFEPDLEEQQEHAHLGQEVQRGSPCSPRRSTRPKGRVSSPA